MSGTNSEINAPAARIWLFQANPKKYEIHKAIAEKSEDYWNLNQYARDVRLGDRVIIWIAGDEAGIYAIGTIITQPVMMADAPSGMSYWLIPSEGTKVKARVLVRFDQKMLEQPLKKTYMLTDPILSGLKVISFPRATNFPVTEEQWQALQSWLDD